ncbi:MAG: WecB/TagA/CpsF family glycosyltransferase [Chloroflexi bacterium]|nr:WecB/TagA/CpsF family glycosyltransferase [Chloroflexota bacterium]
MDPPALPHPRALTFLGVRVHDITFAETLAWMDAAIAAGVPHQICTVNPEFLMLAQRDYTFRAVLDHSDLNVPDGGFLLWAAWRRGDRLRERVTGSDGLPLFAALAARKGYRLFFLGAAEGIARRAADILAARNPGLQIAGCYAGSPALDDEDAIIARVQATRPDALFVAFGAPQQDLWIARNAARLGVPVMMGIGGAFDFIAGAVPRAPQWMRRAGLEWLFRLIRQPWRWRRQLAIWQFAWLTLQGRV